MPDLTSEVVADAEAALPGVVAAVEADNLHDRVAALEQALAAVLEHLGSAALNDKAKAKA